MPGLGTKLHVPRPRRELVVRPRLTDRLRDGGAVPRLVLRLLATELTGPEISGRPLMSVNTFRTHTRHIFTKLDVNTRRAAVLRGGALDLL